MYYLIGFQRVVEVIENACKFTQRSADLSNQAFQEAYWNYLKNNSVFECNINSNQIRFTNFQGMLNLSPKFYLEKKEFFSENSPLLKNRLDNNFFNEGLKKLENLSEELYSLVTFLIKVVLVNQLNSYTNGTTQETLGLANLDFKDHFNQQDFIELLVHQATHMMLFLDDTSQPHLANKHKNKMIETELKSKLGTNQFPLYVAFHSLIVGTEILHFRHNTVGLELEGNCHGKTKKIIACGRLFKKSLEPWIHLFTKRGKDLFDKSGLLLNQATELLQLAKE
jgi:hypothetical protein